MHVGVSVWMCPCECVHVSVSGCNACGCVHVGVSM